MHSVQHSSLTVNTLLQVVGMATHQPMLDILPLLRNFLLAQAPGLEQQHATEGRVLQLQLATLNPIFAHRAEQMLLELLQHAKAQAMVYLLPPDQAAPDVLSCFRYSTVWNGLTTPQEHL